MDMGIPSCKKAIAAGAARAKAKVESVKGQSSMAWFLQILFVVQILMILYVNYTKAYGLFDYDSALSVRHGMEMWKHGLFLKDFEYYSSIEIDTVTFFGSLLYLLTGNLKIALAISHLVGCVVIAALILDICQNLHVTREQSLMALVMVFAPYSAGQLDWANMIFICGGQYGFRIMTLLFLLDMLLSSRNQKVGKTKFAVLLAACLLLIFWTSVSTGNFVLFMIIFPLFCWEGLEVYRNRRFVWKSKENLVIFLSIAVSLAGWMLRNHYIGATHRESLLLVSEGNMFTNLHASIMGVFKLFGGSAGSDVPVFSADGIFTLLHFFVPCCCIWIIWSEWHRKEKRTPFLRAVLTYSVIYFGVLLLLDTTVHGPNVFEYRYHILWCILLVISAGISIAGKWQRGGSWVVNAPVYGFLLLIVACNLWQDYWFIKKPEQIAQFNDVIERGKALNADAIYFYDKDEHAAIIRLFVPEWYCISVKYGEEGMEANTGDFYQHYGDQTAASPPHMLLCGDAEFEALPNYIKSCYQKLEGGVYWAEVNPWDGSSGLPGENVDVAVDFPYSAGYFGSGELADNGVLVGNPTENDDYLLRGTNTEPVPGTYDITLSYGIFQDGSQPSRFEVIVDDREILAEADLLFGEDTVTLEGVEVSEGEWIEFRVWKPKDAIITVKQFTFERVH